MGAVLALEITQTKIALAEGAGDFERETVLRAASLLANGLSDSVVLATLLLEEEQLIAIKATELFVMERARQADEVLQRNINIARGWDAVEEKSVARVLALVSSPHCDSRYALAAARVANGARRPMTSGSNQLNGNNPENVHVLQLPTELTKILRDNPKAIMQVDVSVQLQGEGATIPLKQSIIPSPEFVQQQLGVQEAQAEEILDGVFEELGEEIELREDDA